MAQQKRIAEEKLKTLEQWSRTRSSDYQWTKDELKQVAPEYGGSAAKFSLIKYIENFKRRTTALQISETKAKSTADRRNIVEDTPISLQQAAMELFHMACPHPIRYRNDDDEIDIEAFSADLALWMADITSIWIKMSNTEHQDDCKCCINFLMLATNYERQLKRMMSEYDFESKRVSKAVISRWAAGLSSEGPREAMLSIKEIGRSLLTGEENSMILELTDESSNLSDTEDAGVLSVTTEEQYAEGTLNARIESKLELEATQGKRLRRRKSARRPLDTVTEVSDEEGILSLAITEIGVAVQIRVPLTGYNSIGRNEICEYAKIYLQQIIRAKQTLSIGEMASHKVRLRNINIDHAAYLKTKKNLAVFLEGAQNVYTTRSRKKARASILDM